MIIQGKPELGLQKHQQDAYKSIQKAYERGNKASIVIPTGCGKSFIALQLMADNKDKRILFMAPTNAIKNQMYNYIAKYIAGEEPTKERTAKMIAEDYFPNLKIMLYPSLLRIKDEQMEKLNADIIIMDELHRTGADKWGERIDTLLEKNPNAQILGLTATPDRMDDKKVIDELFEGNIDYELTLIDALRNGIVKSPTYVKCDYALGGHLEGIRIAIANCKDEQQKKELQDKYDRMRRIVEQADGIPELFAKNIKKKDGKYIIFCKNKEHMDELMNKAKEWFSSIDTEPEMYSVYSGEGYTEKANKETIENFEKSKSEHLKLLFSVEMLNEGLHVEDISGVIMARPTDSRIIYLQQLGRALSSDTSRDKTIVFDLVNNYLKNNLDAEVNNRTNGDGDQNKGGNNNGGQNGGHRGGNYGIEDIDIFRIQGETKEFLKLLEEVQGIIDISNYLINARAIKAWIEKTGNKRRPSQHSEDQEEKRLGLALQRIINNLIKPYKALQTETERKEFKEKYPEIDEILEIVNEIDKENISPYLKRAREIKEWMNKRKTTNPPSSNSKDDEEKRNGRSLITIKHRLIKPYKALQTEIERQEFREKYPEIDEILAIINEIDVPIQLRRAREIKAWIEKSGGTKPPSHSSNEDEEKRLATALTNLRRNLINPFRTLQTEEERKEFKKKHPEIDAVLEIINEIDKNNISPYLKKAVEIKKWIEESGDTKPPSYASQDEEERRYGSALSEIRRLIKSYLDLQTEEEKMQFRNKYPEIEEVLEIVNEIDKNNISPYLVHAREIKEWMRKQNSINPPSKSSNNEEESSLGRYWETIRLRLITPYLQIETEEGREKFREEHPELDEVMSIVSEIYTQFVSRSKKQQELALLIRQDLEKRRALQQARKLEQDYEEQLSMKKGEEIKTTKEQGVNFDE